jgi:D-sedoheptulose 7-phosphate isomerase
MFADALLEIARGFQTVAASEYSGSVHAAVDLLCAQFLAGSKLLVFGNGGSSADAQHITGELMGRFLVERRPLPVVALTANQAVLTALSNDYSFDVAIARQVEALGAPGDVAWGISTSGNSPNVLNGLRTARERGLHTVGLTGASGGGMAPLCDVLMAVPLRSTPRIQEVHLATYHYICDAVEQAIVRGGKCCGIGNGRSVG